MTNSKIDSYKKVISDIKTIEERDSVFNNTHNEIEVDIETVNTAYQVALNLKSYSDSILIDSCSDGDILFWLCLPNGCANIYIEKTHLRIESILEVDTTNNLNVLLKSLLSGV